ncbi:MAG: hypothetical protein K8U03_00985 [Planctomycetia bacterium]|nr:hypothetical protein [Planctomycetia bacterium]
MKKMFTASIVALALSASVGCQEPTKPAGSVAGSSPSLDAKNADERAAAAREAAKKYGANP